MKECYLYKKIDQQTVQCQTCSHFCVISPGKRGRCGVRENIDGKLFAVNYDKVIATAIDPIEKKPLFHFLPGSLSYSIATVGCNLACGFCQNYEISQSPKKGGVVIGEETNPKKIIQEALKYKCASISYTYTEPTIFLELALDTMKLAKKTPLRSSSFAGRAELKNIWVSNGFMSPQTLNLVSPFLDAINVDLKSFSEKFYQKLCEARLAPILKNLKEIYKNKIHLEITTLIIPGENDSEKELTQIAKFIKEELGPEVPWHISRFFPTYQLYHLNPTSVESIHKAYEIGKKEGLKFVYAGNLPGDNIDGTATESTYCSNCKKLVLGRIGFEILKNNLDNSGVCKFCKSDLNIKMK